MSTQCLRNALAIVLMMVALAAGIWWRAHTRPTGEVHAVSPREAFEVQP